MLPDPLTEFFQVVRQGDDQRAEELVAMLGTDALPHLQARLSDPDAEVRWWAVRALAALQGHPHTLAKMLDDADDQVRACAALALALHSPIPPPEPVIEALIAHLADPSPRVGDGCALALARMGPAASPALVRALEENPHNAVVRFRAARALASVATPEAVPALVRALEDESSLVQYYAQDALERLGVGLVLFKP